MKFIDLFAGIGGFRLGMESAGHECAAFCEIDKFARASYKAIHDTEGEEELHDITAVTDEQWSKYKGSVDVITGGFPCQSFSIAGKRGGFDDVRGTMFFEIARAVKQIKPRLLFLENVKGLLSHDKGQTFATILNTLDEIGYDAEWQLLNSKNFGVPQNRERVFIVGHLRGTSGRKVFPITGENGQITGSVKQLGNISESVSFGGNPQTGRVYAANGISPTLNTMGGGSREPKIAIKEATKQGYAIAKEGDSVNLQYPESKTRRGRVGNQIANTLQATGDSNQGVVIENPLKGKTEYGWHFEQNVHGGNGLARTVKAGGGSGNIPKVITGYRIRKLTPKECWRLQSFPDSAFEKAQEVNSNSQLYKQAGNSVTVNVIKAIATKL